MQVEEKSLCVLPDLWSLSVAWLTFYVHSYLTFIAKCMLCAPPKLAPGWTALCKWISLLLNSQWDQVDYSSKAGSLFIFTWTVLYTIDSASYPRNCLFKSDCVWVAQAQTIVAIQAGLGVVYILPDLFICGVVPSLEMPDCWSLCLILYLLIYLALLT